MPPRPVAATEGGQQVDKPSDRCLDVQVGQIRIGVVADRYREHIHRRPRLRIPLS
jgi:hypothetical protein